MADVNGVRYDALPKKRIDITPSTIYIGYATKSTADATRGWTIKKVALTSGSPTSVTWTAETGAVWDDRATEVYG